MPNIALLAVKYRQVNAQGQMCGGPMYVLQYGMNNRWLGLCFAAFCAIAAFGIGNSWVIGLLSITVICG